MLRATPSPPHTHPLPPGAVRRVQPLSAVLPPAGDAPLVALPAAPGPVTLALHRAVSCEAACRAGLGLLPEVGGAHARGGGEGSYLP